MYKSRYVAAGIFAVAALAATALGFAATYPDRPVRIIVPFPPGGGNDLLARAMAQRLSETMGQQFVVDNRGGAGGLIGGQIASTSASDGYTLCLGSMGLLAHNPALRPDLPYNPVRDFSAISLLVTSPFVLVVHPSVQAKSVQDPIRQHVVRMLVVDTRQ